MFNRPESEEAQKLNAQIDRVLESMNTYGPGTPEYPDLLALLERLNEQKTKMKRPPLFSPDAILGTVSTLGSVLIIVAYEQRHVWLSKATGFIPKSQSN